MIILCTLFCGHGALYPGAVTVSAAVATRSRADCGSMEDRRRKSLINFLLIKCLILTTSDIPIFVDFQYVVYNYFTQIINFTDILLQFVWGRIVYSLD